MRLHHTSRNTADEQHALLSAVNPAVHRASAAAACPNARQPPTAKHRAAHLAATRPSRHAPRRVARACCAAAPWTVSPAWASGGRSVPRGRRPRCTRPLRTRCFRACVAPTPALTPHAHTRALVRRRGACARLRRSPPRRNLTHTCAQKASKPPNCSHCCIVAGRQAGMGAGGLGRQHR